MARTSSVSQAKRSWRGEGDRRRHMKNPEAATPRMRQHRLAEKPRPQLGGDHPYRPTGPHERYYPSAELRIVGSWHASSSALGRASLA
jgi:hypothetical protein